MNNGYKFQTKEYENDINTQNNGVMVTTKILSYTSTSDPWPIMEDVINYSLLIYIVELNYYVRFKVILFKCGCINLTQGKGLKQDALGSHSFE